MAALKLSLLASLSSPPKFHFHWTGILCGGRTHSSFFIRNASTVTKNNNNKKKKKKGNDNGGIVTAKPESLEEKMKKRTRSDIEFDKEQAMGYGDTASHVPVMLGEVLELFSCFSSSSSSPLRSFVDCTLGAAGHSSAIIRAHSELELYVGMDVDPIAHERARARIHSLCGDSSHLKAHVFMRNFKNIKSVLREVDEELLSSGVDGILMDLGMSSMQVNNAERGFSVLANGPLDMRMDPQATLTAEDILNSWPDTEVGRILREYGEESNWRSLQNKIVKARLLGGLHSTGELADLIRNTTCRTRGGRQGWIKTATRVFQALRIAVNDELKTLEDSLYVCFDCLASGGRLAVISFHSLEDRIVKQTFLNIIDSNSEDEKGEEGEEEQCRQDVRNIRVDNGEREAWIKQMIQGRNGTILTKRPITPSEEEERLNRRSRSAKLRVIQKS